MRFDSKLNALQEVIKDGQFALTFERILNNQYVKIHNWDSICTALRVLREVDWLPEDSNRRLLDDYLENRGYGASIEVPTPEFEALLQAFQRYNSGLPIVMNILQTQARSTPTDTVWVEIKSVSDPNELAVVTRDIQRVLDIAGQTGSSFRFVGVAQGSDWLGFLPGSELTGIALAYCISLAATASFELMRVAGPIFVAMVRRSIADRDGDGEPTQDEINARIELLKEDTRDVIIDEGVKTFVEYLKDADYPPEVRNEVGNAVKAATKAIQDLGESDRALFEVSDSQKGIVVEIHGDNNQITVQNFPRIPPHIEALSPGESE